MCSTVSFRPDPAERLRPRDVCFIARSERDRIRATQRLRLGAGFALVFAFSRSRAVCWIISFSQ